MKKILIADDNLSLCNVLRDFFASKEYIEICNISNNGIDTINSILKLRPDIVLLDLIMPKLDGIEVLKRLNPKKGDEKLPKIIVMSAVGQDSILKEAFLYGIQYYMIKPFSLRALEERIKFILNFESQNNTNVNDNDLLGKEKLYESSILKSVINVGIPTNILGYRYTIEALKIILNNPNTWLVSDLYKSIAQNYSTSEQCVENALRNAISRAYQKENSFYQNLFPKNISERKPSNSLFLTVLAEYIKIESI